MDNMTEEHVRCVNEGDGYVPGPSHERVAAHDLLLYAPIT